ncbi:MAG: hypothetical protein H3C28_02445 [Sphingomonadales bacterium]|nr:hypothetical protein [Sphingomonadales bacterium]
MRQNKDLSAPLEFEQPETIVAMYFDASLRARKRWRESGDSFFKKEEYITSVFMALAGFEAFLNCYFSVVANELKSRNQEKIIKLCNDRFCSLIEKARKLPLLSFNADVSKFGRIFDDIDSFIKIRNELMHLKHTWKSVEVGNIRIEGLITPFSICSGKHTDPLYLIITIRKYIKNVFRLAGVTNTRHFIDRWTKHISRWRVPQY